VKQALADLEIPPHQVVMVSGIGQAAKAPHYLRANVFNGLHGRAIPPATGIKAANPHLTVIVESGDGDMYGEGGNHFIHGIRRNPDITCLVHNNMVYGLTKGQASPTTPIGFTTTVQSLGVFEEPLNPIAVAIVLGASFVARGFAGDKEGLTAILKAAIAHRGFSLVDILQPCVTFNKVNTFAWFRERIAPLPSDHDAGDRDAALRLALAPSPLHLGIFYAGPGGAIFEEQFPVHAGGGARLCDLAADPAALQRLVESKR
jgi:2-oxoglutarate ferredoxin oxidoreductase subunit beta